MAEKKLTTRPGVTLTELMVTITMAIIVIFGIGIVVADSHRGWYRMYNRVYSDVVTDGYVARMAFDRVVRKASMKRYQLSSKGDSVEVYYYDNFDSHSLDRYAYFYRRGQELMVDYGQLDASLDKLENPLTMTLAHNVESVNFSVGGDSVQMILRLDNGRQALTVTSSAVRHNK